MNEKYLVINAGSSSLKFSLYSMPDVTEIVNGLIEKIGNKDSSYTLKFNNQKIEKSVFIKDHTESVKVMISELLNNKFIEDISEIKGVGHRVLHGGEFYSESTIIDDEVLYNIKNLTKLGPLHHPGEIQHSIKQCLRKIICIVFHILGIKKMEFVNMDFMEQVINILQNI